jgi:hypothetical protein
MVLMVLCFTSAIWPVRTGAPEMSRRRLPYNVQTVCVPGKVIRPPLAARIEQWDDLVRLWIASFDAIAPTFFTVAAGQGQVIVRIRAPSRLGQYMVDGKA